MPFWACAQLHPQRERLALHTLGLAGYTTYLPRLCQHRVAYGRRVETAPALFPGYAFVLIELQWHAARWAPGVGGPCRAPTVRRRRGWPDVVIAEIRGRERAGLVELPPRFKPGDRVRILRGPFAEQLAIYDGMAAHERVAVLLSLLGGRQRVTLSADAVELAR